MLESLTVFSPGGLIYYQYIASTSLFQRKKATLAGSAGLSSNNGANKHSKKILQLPDGGAVSDASAADLTTALFNCQKINSSLINKVFLHPTNDFASVTASDSSPDGKTVTNSHIDDGLTFVWMAENAKMGNRFCVVAVYPDIIFEGPRV